MKSSRSLTGIYLLPIMFAQLDQHAKHKNNAL